MHTESGRHAVLPIIGIRLTRAHQGYRTQGRTPFQTFSEGVEQMRREEVKPEAA